MTWKTIPCKTSSVDPRPHCIRGYLTNLLAITIVLVAQLVGEVGSSAEPDSATVTAFDNVKTVVTGRAYAAALRKDGTVWYWYAYSEPPTPWDNQEDAVELAGGRYHGCIRKVDKSVWCTEYYGGPFAEVPGVAGALQITAGDGFNCALMPTGKIKCWGTNSDGQLGNGTKTNSNTPVTVKNIKNARLVTAGQSHACALRSDGAVWCWGLNRYGQLGDNSKKSTAVPVKVQKITGVNHIDAGRFHTCARIASTAWCWGNNEFGQIGDGTYIDRLIPTEVKTLSDVRAVNASWYVHTCARRVNGTVWCWGRNNAHQMGDGTYTNRPLPVKVKNMRACSQISGGGMGTYAKDTNDTLWRWGWYDFPVAEMVPSN